MTTDALSGRIRSMLEESAAVKRRAAESEACIGALRRAAEVVALALSSDRKLLICGNGGSAADSQHIAAELVVRLQSARPRRALAALALSTDTSIMTACGNDFSFADIFARQVEALGAPGDVLLGISTSGNSPNVIRAFEAATARGMKKVLFGGGGGGKLLPLADVAFIAPSTVTSHIQETHVAAYHAFLFALEDILLGAP